MILDDMTLERIAELLDRAEDLDDSRAKGAILTNGLCACGCGNRTNLATRNDARRGTRIGDPISYIWGHNRRGKKNPVARFAALKKRPKEERCAE